MGRPNWNSTWRLQLPLLIVNRLFERKGIEIINFENADERGEQLGSVLAPGISAGVLPDHRYVAFAGQTDLSGVAGWFKNAVF